MRKNMMMSPVNFAVIVPMANESAEFDPFTSELASMLDKLGFGKVYLVIDKVSVDDTLALSRALSERDQRFVTIYEPGNRNIVDAYLRGYKEAYERGHEFIIEMDAGLSHDPKSIPDFLAQFRKGHDCVFGSRFIKGGYIDRSSMKRVFLSRFGTFLSNALLGSRMYDMTSGYQGFRASVVKQILDHGLLSEAHFYQTEVRYLLRKKNYIEIPITYMAPSPSVSQKAISNSIKVLFYYFVKRISFNSKIIR